MKKANRSAYREALREALRLVTVDKALVAECRFIVLLGSVWGGEHVAGYSDLDILFVLKSDKDGAISEGAAKALQAICASLSKEYPIKISFLTHTEKEFSTYVNYEYLRHYSWGEVLYGDKKLYKSFFDKLLRNKKPSQKELRREMYLTIMHARFNLIRKYVSLNRYNTKDIKAEMLKLFIDNLLEIADWRLIAEGVWCASKADIAKQIDLVSKSPSRFAVKRAYQLRKRTSKQDIGASTIKGFCEDGIRFINDCAAELGKSI